MSAGYKGVQWNKQKLLYDLLVLAGLVLFLRLVLTITPLLDPNVDMRNLEIRAFGSATYVMLTLAICIGPLTRLDRRFLPLLYNRRHLGVMTCLVGLYHANLVLGWYHDFGNVDPVVSLFISNTDLGSAASFPFQLLGVGALAILVLMAATSHDFWLANLTAPVWKALHMCVYLAYLLALGHVALGALQDTDGIVPTLVMGFVTLTVMFLHLAAAHRDRELDPPLSAVAEGWVDAGPVANIPEGRARIVTVSGERVAVFRYSGKVSAVSNVCQHQNGPLGEGKVIRGLVTCPWHGYNYNPADGISPPPFTEKIPTFAVELRDGNVWVDPVPRPAGTYVEPALIPGDENG